MSVRHAILGLLERQPRHGYELRTAFEALVGDAVGWAVKPAQIYTTIQRLEEAGLVECLAVKQSGGPEKRIYSVTPAGSDELREWLSTPVAAAHERDAFYVKFMIAVACAEAGDHAESDDRDLSALLKAQRAGLYRELHKITAKRDGLDPRARLAQILLYDKAVMHLDADLRWLDMIEARLDEVVSQPIPLPLPQRRGRPPAGRTDDGGSEREATWR